VTSVSVLFLVSLFSLQANASDLKVGDPAPEFKLKNQVGKEFDLATRKDKWTVLYFYPKSETPGCTKQACAFRDSIDKIHAEGADVFGISVNSVKDQLGFHDHHKLTFDLLADDEAKVTVLYGSKMPVMNMAKRWTFIVGPDLKIRAIDRDVDPAKDAEHVAAQLKTLKTAKL
jgi:peroxiredoxin Q/BCP